MSNVEHLAEGVTLHSGDCLEVLDSLPENSIDAVVTDPPYELGFMGKSWDASGIAFRSETWANVMRVLKPGGHLVAFGAPKNYHRLTCAIEDAGFEIRDSLMWVFGSGFPKSLDVSKAIDKLARRDLVKEKILHFMQIRGETAKSLAEKGAIPSPASIGDWTIREHSPSDKNWQKIKAILQVSSEEEREFERQIVAINENVIRSKRHSSVSYSVNSGSEYITAPATDDAKQWEGWGTALKPAYEPIVLARKPLSEGTVAANVLRWGTGAINIDATRIEHNEECKPMKAQGIVNSIIGQSGRYEATTELKPGGRWPANLCHDGSQGVLDLFPQNSGANGGKGKFKQHAWLNKETEQDIERDKGSAARFFYQVKASKQDRAGSRHPTVKPINLMRWLVRMVTPPGGTVLDPFAGSGTTGVAAVNEGFNIIMIEKEEEYQKDIRSRFNDGQK